MLKRNFAVIGHPIGHSMSPFIHKKLFELSNRSGEYCAIDIAIENLKDLYQTTLSSLAGYNITIPHKRNIMELIDEIDPKAKMYGSVNTVANGNKAVGYTTDPDGFLKALANASIDLSGNVVVLGSGGVSRIMVFEAALKDCNVVISHRPEDIAEANLLCNEAKEKTGNNNIICVKPDQIMQNVSNKKIDLLVNATPVGMFPKIDNCPIDDKIISYSQNAFDAVYNPQDTLFLKKCRSNGAKAVGGMSMLVFQAVKSHEIWDNVTYKKDDIDSLIEQSNYEMHKIFKGE